MEVQDLDSGGWGLHPASHVCLGYSNTLGFKLGKECDSGKILQSNMSCLVLNVNISFFQYLKRSIMINLR